MVQRRAHGRENLVISPKPPRILPPPADEQHHQTSSLASAIGPTSPERAGRPPDLASIQATAHRPHCPQPPTGRGSTTTARDSAPAPVRRRAGGHRPSRCSKHAGAANQEVACQQPPRLRNEDRRAALGWCLLGW